MVVNRKDRKRKAAASTPHPVPNKLKQQFLPEPKTGSRPTIRIFESFRNKKNVPVRVLLDTRCDTPMMSKLWADSHGVPLVIRPEPKIVENFNGESVDEADWQYTFPVTLRYESYYIKKLFTIGPMEDSSDIMLPYW
jgi:hypothetical protein